MLHGLIHIPCNTLENRYFTLAFCSNVLGLHNGKVQGMRVLGNQLFTDVFVSKCVTYKCETTAESNTQLNSTVIARYECKN